MNRSVSIGSWPSRPTTISRVIDARGGFTPVIARQSILKGQMSSDAIAIRIVVKRTRNEESSAKPAPGPMYASAGAALRTSAPATSDTTGKRAVI